MRGSSFKLPETLGFVKEFQSFLRPSILESSAVRKSVFTDWELVIAPHDFSLHSEKKNKVCVCPDTH